MAVAHISVFVTEDTHEKLKVLAAAKKKPMGQLVGEMVYTEWGKLKIKDYDFH